MASKRMFATSVMWSDNFLALPVAARELYVHLCLAADDDGIIANPKAIIRFIGARKNAFEALLDSEFIYEIVDKECHIYVIRHWLQCNSVRKDRKTPSLHCYILEQFEINANREYQYKQGFFDNQMTTTCQPNVRIEQTSIVKDSIEVVVVKGGIASISDHPEMTDEKWKDLQEHIPRGFIELIDDINARKKGQIETIKNPYNYIYGAAKKQELWKE